MIQGLVDKGVVQDLQISSYEREVERYGGVELIDRIEQLFCLDSAIVLEMLRIKKELQLPIYVLAALSIQDLLRRLNFDQKKQLAFF